MYTGSFAGYVFDSDSAPLHNAEVWVEQDSVISNTFCDTDGKFALIGLPVGKYTAYATKAGYDTVSVKKVDIVSGNETLGDFVLTLQ